MRAFIAVELSAEARQSLGRLQASLKPRLAQGVKWVDPAGIHLTLKFLGEVAQEKLPQLSEALTEVVQGFTPFSVEIKGLGLFPNARRPRVAWVGVEGETARLMPLQQAVEQASARLGFEPESRPFTPHLTLARLRPEAPVDFAQRFLAAPWQPSPPFRVEGIHLMRSQLTPQGAIYSCLGSFSFLT